MGPLKCTLLFNVLCNTYLLSPRKQNGNEPEILASILNEFIL